MFKQVVMSFPELAHFIYAGRVLLRRGFFLYRPLRGLYMVSADENTRFLQEDLEAVCDDIVVVFPSSAGGGDVVLSNPMDYVYEIAVVRKIRTAKNLKRSLSKLSSDEFCHFVKMSCVLGRWYREILTAREKVYNLFVALSASKVDFLHCYFLLRNHMSAPELFSSILTFLARISVYEDQKDSLSEFYQQIVRKGKSQSMGLIGSIRNLLRGSDAVSLDLRVVRFCFDLRG